MSLSTLDLSPEEEKTVSLLLACGQQHLFAAWPPKGESDAEKRRLLAQCAELDKTVPGGIQGYVNRAKQLLEDSRSGANPYEGFKPVVPTGVRLETESSEGRANFDAMEALGMADIGKTAFTMVAGGLGERLGYNGIKIALPSEITTETTFLEMYIKNILAFQAYARKAENNEQLLLPLAIMTSGDTDGKTRALLDANHNFGMRPDQLTIVKQELVPALLNNSAHFALSESDKFAIDVKPHGHGDVHTLLYQSGLTRKWASEGRKWLVFFQDTNGLVFRALPAAVGVSISKNLAVNSLAVPRKPGEAVGAICKLEGESKSMTINVEYNQLDALFKASGLKDEVDQKTGFSNYPGNINVLVFSVPDFAKELDKSHGVISEFVNPKYSDKEKTTFTKPTRLECMMQDYPKLLAPDVPVGFSEFERWISFSAVKNNIKDAVGKQAQTGAAESGASGEFDIYRCHRRLLSLAGAEITVDGKEEKYENIKVPGGARVVLAPSFGLTQAAIRSRVTGKVRISDRSTLVLEGDITLKNLDLDGTLVVRVAPGASLTIDGASVSNKGWSFLPNSEGSVYCQELKCAEKSPCPHHPVQKPDEKYVIRGFTLIRTEQTVVEVREGAKVFNSKVEGSHACSI